MESLRITAAQIESARMSILKEVGRKGLTVWVRVFPHVPVTKKALGVRMGKGKGAVDHFVANLKAGKMVFEYNCPTETLARLAFRQVSYKLPVKVKFLARESEQLLIH
jgi:large subunit ribosomal protein L16